RRVVGTVPWVASRAPTTNCDDTFLPDSTGHVILASKVVLFPWFGPHHVYGIFFIPDQCRDRRYSATVTIRGVREPASLGQPPVPLSDGSVKLHGETITIQPGQF